MLLSKDKDEIKRGSKSNIFYKISPFVIGMFLCIIVLVWSQFLLKSSGGWSFIGIIIFLPLLIVLFGLDILLKYLFFKKTLWIWIIELIATWFIYTFYLKDYGIFD